MCKISSIYSRTQFSKFLDSVVAAGKYFLAGTCLVLGVSALGLAQQSTPAPTQQAPATAPQQVPTTPSTGAQKSPAPRPSGAGAPVDSGSYKVGPTDILFINVWHEQEFSGPVAVHEDGKITLPLVGDLAVGDKTPNEIEKIVSEALSKYVVNPLVTVTVQEVRSKKYYLDGEVAKPGEYPLVAPTTILEAISKAGGLAMFANTKKIYVLRGDQRIPFNYKDVIRGKNMKQNILLKPDDHIFVP